MTVKISGMTCSHCASNVARALKEVNGVEDVSVDLKGGSATVTGSGIDEAEIREEVEKAGYEVTGIVD